MNTPFTLGPLCLQNRIVRSATYEGFGDAEGCVSPELARLYAPFFQDSAGMVITGFTFVSEQGRAMHPRQCGMTSEAHSRAWKNVVAACHDQGSATRMILQLAHAGRQTLQRVTRQPVVGASNRRCTYFRETVEPATPHMLAQIIEDFAAAAARAQEAGFDGVQLHAGHGYLLHQFISPWTNTRADEWRAPEKLLRDIADAIRARCGRDFALLAKMSVADDRGLTPRRVAEVIAVTDFDGVELSYGTMEHALNIFRGGCPARDAFRVNPFFKRIPRLLRALALWRVRCWQKPFTPCYNLRDAQWIAARVQTPVWPVGGFRNTNDIAAALKSGMPLVSLCRPFIAEPHLLRQLQNWKSACVNCNRCAIYCDAPEALTCRKEFQHG